MLLEWIVSASVLTAAVLLLRLVFRRRVSQRLQYLLWLPVLVRLLLPVPLFHSRISVSGAAERLAPAAFAEVTAAPRETPAPVQTTPAPAQTAAPQPAQTAAPVTAPPDTSVKPTSAPAVPEVTASPAPAAPLQLDWGALLARLWLAGGVAMGLWLLGVNLRFARSLRRDRRELRSGAVPVYVSVAVSSPCLFGLIRPAVYLTPACAELPEEELGQVILHEETHRKQGDHIWGVLRCLALAVWWWNPLVWLASLCSRRDGELSCDEKVMKLLGEEKRLDYGRTLVSLLPEKAPRALLTAATLSGGARAMKERLDRIVKKPKRWAVAAAVVLLLAAVAVLCAFAGRPAKNPAPAPTPTPTPVPTSELQPAEDLSGLIMDGSVTVSLRYETYSLADIRKNAADQRAKRASGERVVRVDFIDANLITMEVMNHAKQAAALRPPELETFREGAWYRLDYEMYELKGSALADSLEAQRSQIACVPLTGVEDGYLLPGKYRICILYSLGEDRDEPDHAAIAEFEIAEAREPQSLLALLGRNPDELETLDWSGPLGSRSLQRGEEGFQDIVDLLGSLRGSPASVPYGVVRRALRLTDGSGSGSLLELWYDGERVYASFGDNYQVLEAEGRPDEELEALFARYAAAPEPALYDPGQYVVDGLLGLTPAQTYYGYESLRAAVTLSLRRFTEPQPVGESLPPEEGAIVRLTAENLGEETIWYDLPYRILAQRDGKWYWVPTRYEFTNDLIARSLAPGGTLETGVPLDIFDDPLEPGQYCVCMFYTVGETLRSPYNHVAFAPFVITDGEPQPTPEPTPDDGTELLVRIGDPDRVDRIRYTYERWAETYSLRRGDEGFEEALDILLSLRGTPCEKPENLTYSRTFELDSTATLAFDGERVCGCDRRGRWLRLDTEGRPDLALAAVFERFGRTDPTDSSIGDPANHDGQIEDEGFTARTEEPSYALEPLVTAIQELHDAGADFGDAAFAGRITIPLILHNGLEDTCMYSAYSYALEILQDGEWRVWNYTIDAFALTSSPLQAGEEKRIEVPMAIYRRPLIAGHYRFAFTYTVGKAETGQNKTHVAFAEFDLTDGEPVPTPTPTPEPSPEPTPTPEPTPVPARPQPMADSYFSYTPLEDRDDFMLLWPLPVGWTARRLVRDELAAMEPHYLMNSTPTCLYILDAEGRCVGAVGCAACDSEGTNGEIYSGLDLGGWRFDVVETYDVVYADDAGENALTTVYYSADTRAGLGEEAAEKRNDGVLCRSDDLGVYAALELESGVLTDAELRAMARGLRLIRLPLPSDETTPEPTPEPTPTPTPEPQTWQPVTVEQWTDWLTLPEGARWLTEEEIASWTAWFDADWMRRQFLNSAYARPQDVDLAQLFYMGADLREVGISSYDPGQFALTVQQKRAALQRLGALPAYGWTDGLRREDMDALLRKYLGLGLDETARRGLEWPYFPETGIYVHDRSDGNWRSWPIRYGCAVGDEVWLFYQAGANYFDAQSGLTGWCTEGVYRVVLRQTGGGVRFVSNERALTNGAEASYDVPYLAPSWPSDDLDSGRDVTVQTLTPEVFESYEAARADTEAIHFSTRHVTSEAPDGYYDEVVDTIHIKYEQEYPGYGVLLYGELGTGTMHDLAYMYFLTYGGLRYRIGEPSYMMGSYRRTEDWSEANQGMGFMFSGAGADTAGWWMRCPYAVQWAGAGSRQNGLLEWTLYLPTMEVFMLFTPDN